MDFEIKQADILLVRGKDGLSHEIEVVERSPYSHAALIVKAGELIEAQAGRVTGYQSLSIYQGCSDVFTLDSLTDDQRKQIVANVMKHIGDKYAYKLIAWEAVHYILHIDLPMHLVNEEDCSTLCINYGYRPAGSDPCPGVANPSPGDIGKSLMRKIGSF